MNELTWISILPPVVAIVLAIWTRQVYISLFAGIYLGCTILCGWNPLAGAAASLDSLLRVFQDSGNTGIILFCGLVGGLIALTRSSGGVDGFVETLSRRGWLKSRRSAQLMSGIIGGMIFVETSISCLVVGAVSRPIYDRLKISREKLAFVCDSTCAPINLLIPLNAWGAFIIGLLAKENIPEPVGVLMSSMVFNFYAFASLGLVFILVLTGKDFGPMKKAERRAREEGKVLADHAKPVMIDDAGGLERCPGIKPRASNMIIPIAVMILMMPVGLLVTGKGDITAGSGTTSVLWSVVSATLVAVGLYRFKGLMKTDKMMDIIIKGIGGMVPVMILMMFAFAIGDVARDLKTGYYVAGLVSQFVVPSVVPLMLFLSSCFIAFSTGTSWGTFAIMVPIAVPIASSMGMGLPFLLAAVLGGGLFGDHCSPISDTTLVASMASGCDHIDHVRTQLPYALTAAAIASALYLVGGYVAVHLIRV